MLKRLLVAAAVAGAIAGAAAPASADCLLYVRLSDANGPIVEQCVNP